MPDDAWLADPARVYPVTVDPTIKTEENTDVEDNYAGDGSEENTHYNENVSPMLAGNKGGVNYTAYLRQVFPESFKNIASEVIIQEASVRLYISAQAGNQSYQFYRVTGDWASNALTGKNEPSCAPTPFAAKKLSVGNNTIDLKPLVSKWFNSLDQKENHGFAIKGSGTKNSYVQIESSDQHGDVNLPKRVEFSVTYRRVNADKDPAFTAVSYGNEAGSGNGYVDLSWNAVGGAEGYYIAIYNGLHYEYFDVGNVTAFSTKGKGIWPTEEEIAEGRYALHTDGKGAELPCIPAFTYRNAKDSKYKDSLNYYFRLVPCNSYGQAVKTGIFDTISTVLPDRIQPNQAADVKAAPSGYTNAAEVAVSWSGVQDFDTAHTTLQNTLEGGKVQYSVDGTKDWKNTDQNTASGTYRFSVSGYADGVHTVYIRGVDAEGNCGTPKGTYFYLDRTGPSGQSVSVTPSDWTSADRASLRWSGFTDVNGIAGTQYRIDGGNWQETGVAAADCAAYEIDTSALADGEHILELRAEDGVGNTGAAVQTVLKTDRSAPSEAVVSAAPEGWSNEDTCILTWSGIADSYSGTASAEYRIWPYGAWTAFPSAAEAGSAELDLSGCPDGECRIEVRAWDYAGNCSETASCTVYRDTEEPEVQILAPADRAILDGAFDITASVQDANLAGWKLTAADSTGEVVIVSEGSAALDGEIAGSVDFSAYPDGENLLLTLSAWDEAGNEAEETRSVIRIGGSMARLQETLALSFPKLMKKPQEKGSCVSDASGDSSPNGQPVLYIDGEPQGTVTGGAFYVDAVKYETGSSHTVSALMQTDGMVQCSAGIGTEQLLDMLWEDGAPADTGMWQSELLTSVRPMLGLRLNVTEFTPEDSQITYEYTTDRSGNWQTILPDADVVFTSPADSVQVRTVFHAAGDGKYPELYRMAVQGIMELNPPAFTVQLRGTAGKLSVTAPQHLRNAWTQMEGTFPENAVWYMDGKQIAAQADKINVLSAQERTGHRFTAAASSDETLSGLNGELKTLFRAAYGNADGEAESGEIVCEKPVFGLRLLAALHGEAAGAAVFSCSADGKQWYDFPQKSCYADAGSYGSVLLLPECTDKIRIRAQLPAGVTLSGWQLEGLTAGAFEAEVQILDAPLYASAADYGEHEDKRYELTWKDVNPADSSRAYRSSYRVYRSGTLLAETADTKYTDRDYQKDASYEISAVRMYADMGEAAEYRERESLRTKAEITRIRTQQTVEKEEEGTAKKREEHTLEEYEQPKQLTSLYGGNETFVLGQEPPSESEYLDQKLLGKSRHCSLGYEPVNFNTGNYLLEARDYKKEEAGNTLFDLFRTYNSRSSETDGPFGAGWSTAYSQYLNMYRDGSIGLRRSNGALLLFQKTEDGYACDADEHASLTEKDGKFHVILPENTELTFDHYGLLQCISEKGRRTELMRDSRNVLGEVRLADGTSVQFESDENGHIIKMTEPGGAAVTYEYDKNQLVRVTDERGNSVRYTYDKEGRMTQWFDRAGNRQVYNEYDREGRVIYQKDARDGEYTIRYFDDHTETVDAQGGTNEIWFDSQKRTIKEVLENGGEYLYTYDEAGNMCSKTDVQGLLSSYEYDSEGRESVAVQPAGARTMTEYDAAGNIISETDANGFETLYTYDESGRRTGTVYPDGAEEHSTYDEQGRLISFTDANGGITSYTYGERTVSVTDANGNTVQSWYDLSGRLIKERDACGYETNYTYDAGGNLIQVRYDDGSTEQYQYDTLGNVVQETDKNGNVTGYVYDSMGNCTEIHNADGTVSKQSYDSDGNLLQTTDAQGNRTEYTYDREGNKIKEINPLGDTISYEYDKSGKMTKMILPTGAEERYVYDTATGLLVYAVDAAGNEMTYEYDAAGNITAQYDAQSIIQRTEYDCRGRVIKTTDANGAENLYEYDACGNLICETNPLGGKTRYEYDALGQRIKKTDPFGYETAYEYDAAGNLKRQTDPNSAVTSWEYDLFGNKTSQTDAYGNQTLWEYDSNGNITKVTDANGYGKELEYDHMGRMISETLPGGGVKHYKYDSLGNQISEEFPDGGMISWKYDAAGQKTEMKDVLGRTAQFSYDSFGNVTEALTEYGKKTVYEYDAAGRLLEMTDEKGEKTAYTYDSLGQIKTETKETGTISYQYDKAGNIVSMEDENGYQETYQYDLAGNPTEITYPDGSSDRMSYDLAGRLKRADYRDGRYETYDYDACGNIAAKETDGIVTTYTYDLLGQIIRESTGGVPVWYSYDACGRVESMTDSENRKTQYEYDADGNMTVCTLPDGQKTEAAYDSCGRLIQRADANGSREQYAYDKADRLISVTDALGAVTSYEYDRNDRVSEVTDALGHKSAYEYNASGQIICETDASGNQIHYTYSDSGLLSSVTDGNGATSDYTYDESGRITEISYSDGTFVRNSYNQNGSLHSVEGADGTLLYEYDQNDRLSRVTWPDGSSTGYTYDKSGNIASLSYPGGETAAYEYDGFGRLVRVNMPDGTESRYSYDALGRCTHYCDGTNDTAYTYDDSGRLAELAVSGNTSLNISYEYDKKGNISSEIQKEGNRIIQNQYTYDELNRLLSFTSTDTEAENNIQEMYTYDAVGNMIEKIRNGQRVKMCYDEANRLVTKTEKSRKTEYRYDKNGFLTEKYVDGKKAQYQYDAAGQLIRYQNCDGEELSYQYYPTGLLSQKETEENGELRIDTYTYDVLAEQMRMLTETSAKSSTIYVYGSERIAALQENQERTGYIYDIRGNVIQTQRTTRSEEVSCEAYHYTPYGELTAEGQRQTSGYYYNGEYYAAELESYYLRARFYEPDAMRFLAPDVVRGDFYTPQSLNRYAYVQNNPVNYEDPDGEFLLPILAAGVSAGVFNQVIQKQIQKSAENLKTVNAVCQGIAENANLQAFVNAVKKTPLGCLTAMIGGAVVKAVSKPQVEALKEAQEIYQKLIQAKGDEAKELSRRLAGACEKYSESDQEQERPRLPLMTVDDYNLYGQYGFDSKTIHLLKQLRTAIETEEPERSQQEKDWLFAHIIGRMKYGSDDDSWKEHIKWNGTSGKPSTDYARLLIEDYGFADSEYEYLRYKIRAQNELAGQSVYNDPKMQWKEKYEKAVGRKLTDVEFEEAWHQQFNDFSGKGDYAHGQITTASILYDGGGFWNWGAQVYIQGDEETLEDMAGWLGDAVIKNGEYTSFGNDDYIVDLDAENITAIMNKEGVSYEKAVKKYNERIKSGETRASIFLESNKYKEVKKEVLGRLKIESMKELKKEQPDSYNFLMSLKNKDNEMKNYSKKGKKNGKKNKKKN